MRPGLRYFVGLDLGQKQDHTAIAVVEREEIVGTRRDPVTWALDKRTVYAVRYLERMPLGIVVPGGGGEGGAAGAEHPADDAVRAGGGCDGGGSADRGHAAAGETRVQPVAGDDHGRGPAEPGRERVEGAEAGPGDGAAGAVRVGELEVARGLEEGEGLVEELREMQVKVSLGGHESFEAWRSGAHDDLVLAVALACWKGRRV